MGWGNGDRASNSDPLSGGERKEGHIEIVEKVDFIPLPFLRGRAKPRGDAWKHGARGGRKRRGKRLKRFSPRKGMTGTEERKKKMRRDLPSRGGAGASLPKGGEGVKG